MFILERSRLKFTMAGQTECKTGYVSERSTQTST